MELSRYQPSVEEPDRKLSIFIVDNQPLYRQAVRQALDGDVAVVGESSLRADVWSTIEELVPDIALVDVGLPFFSGFSVARQVARRCPKVAVVMISASPDDDQLFQAIKSGAVAFLSKDVSADELAGTLRRVGQGQYPINDSLLNRPNTAEKILRLFHSLSLMGNDVNALVTPLSPRETEVLKHIAEGYSNKRIAFTLGVTEQTIKNYIASIMRKLNANDRTHAVVLAMRRGWLDIGDISDGLENMAVSHRD
ncbi:MAG: response regulator transcription factor [Chloroflexota bacterium]|nr:response regulator transcription factor [Chloroflexota bacterium]